MTFRLRQRMPSYTNMIQKASVPYQALAERGHASSAPTTYDYPGTLDPSVELSTKCIQNFRHVFDYRLYRLEDTSTFVNESEAALIAKFLRSCRGIRLNMKSVHVSSTNALLPFFKDFCILFSARRLQTPVHVRLVSHLFQRQRDFSILTR